MPAYWHSAPRSHRASSREKDGTTHNKEDGHSPLEDVLSRMLKMYDLEAMTRPRECAALTTDLPLDAPQSTNLIELRRTGSDNSCPTPRQSKGNSGRRLGRLKLTPRLQIKAHSNGMASDKESHNFVLRATSRRCHGPSKTWRTEEKLRAF